VSVSHLLRSVGPPVWMSATVSHLPSAFTRAPYFPAGLHTVAFSPALYDTFAIITRTGTRLSPGVRELLTGLESHMRAVAEDLDRSR
jgi:hypothetical protein